MIIILDRLHGIDYLRSVHPERGSDHDSDLERNGCGTWGWGVTFLRLPGASGENLFAPLFDIVKHTPRTEVHLFTGNRGFQYYPGFAM